MTGEKGLRILLIVDDDAAAREVMALARGGLGHQVETVSDTSVAMDARESV